MTKHDGALRYVHFEKHRWAHCYSARAGSWSFRDLYERLYNAPYRQPNDQTGVELARLQRAGHFVSWFVREPVTRFMSVYMRFYLRQGAFTNVQYPMSPAMRAANADGKLFSSVEVFAARAFESFPNDKHIALQGGWGAELADLVAPLDRSDDAWDVILAKVPWLPAMRVPRINVSEIAQGVIVPSIVREFYAADSALYNKVSSDFDSKQLPSREPPVAS